MVAVALHQLAVLLHKQGGLQLHDDWKLWIEGTWPDLERCPTPFVHGWFQEHKQYPEGVADMVGYWAEGRILGGVMLFDRGASGNEEVSTSVLTDRVPFSKLLADDVMVLHSAARFIFSRTASASHFVSMPLPTSRNTRSSPCSQTLRADIRTSCLSLETGITVYE